MDIKQAVSMSGYCEQGCYKHRGVCISLNYNFVQICAQEWDWWITRQPWFQFFEQVPYVFSRKQFWEFIYCMWRLFKLLNYFFSLLFMPSCACSFSRVQLFVTPWIVAHRAPLSIGFPRQEHWSALTFPSPGHLPEPGIEPESPASSSLTGRFFTTEPPGKPVFSLICIFWV